MPGSIADRTDGTVALLTTLRRALVEYRGTEGAAITDVVQERFYQGRAPDNPTFPYGVMRLATRNDGRYHGLRLEADLEVQWYGRPWTQREALEGVADLCDQAMLLLLRNAQGLIFSVGAMRETLPLAGAPADSETVTIRLLYTVVIWPEYLTRLTLTP